MRLRDSLTFTPGGADPVTVPAHVYYMDTAISTDPDVVRHLEATLRAIVREIPGSFDPLRDTITWQGGAYRLEGAPMPRVAGGRLHHYTLNLRTEGT